ncbi:MAG TPA: hypothetical protein VG937_12815 [Polyangiaceae bacterium]|nr:hypothetical protein [Polyangiaceae bacterium]
MALLAAIGAAFWSSAAAAAEFSSASLSNSPEAAVPADVASPAVTSRAQREAYPWSAGARAFIAPPLGIAGLGAGLDLAYSVLPNLALGAQYLAFTVDQGADPDYCEHCIRTGNAAFAFAEGRLWPSAWATPYARLGLGLAHLNGQRFAYDRDYEEDDLALAGEAGLELHHRVFSVRVFAFQLAIPSTELDKDPFAGFGAQLGARF